MTAQAVPIKLSIDLTPQAGSTGVGSGFTIVDSSLLAPNSSTVSDFANMSAWSLSLSGLTGVPSATSFGLTDLFSWVLTTDALGDVIDFNFRTFAQNADGYGLNAIAPAMVDLCQGACAGGSTIGTYNIVNYRTSSVPEPATIALIGLGLVGFSFRRKNQA